MKISQVPRHYKDFLTQMLKRREDNFEAVDEAVQSIIQQVKKNGDLALYSYTEQFDGAVLNDLTVSENEVQQAIAGLDEEFLSTLKAAKDNIAIFHEQQMEKSWFFHKNEGIMLGQKMTPLERVGVYVPGGKAAYPSTVLMNVVPAVIAGVPEIVLVTPPDQNGNINPAVLAASRLAGVSEIYKIGGAQAIAALTYGTETIRPVHKIVGPGNVFVSRAKRQVFGEVAIDMIAGPSEICIIADASANPEFIAADLLSQAEHDELAASILITDSISLANAVKREVAVQIQELPRLKIAREAIANNGHIFVVDKLSNAFSLANEIAPEHLQLMVKDPFEQLPQVKNAGAIFLGAYSPEPLGDYFAGPNHTLPTNGTAKFSSPLGTYDFLKRSSIIYYNESELEKVNKQISRFAEEEGLTAHAKSIQMRFRES